MNLCLEIFFVIYNQKVRSIKSTENHIDCLPWKVIFVYFSKKSNNFLIGLKTILHEFILEQFLCNLRPKNKVHEMSSKKYRNCLP